MLRQVANVTSNVDVSGPTLISGQAECNGAVYEVAYTVTDLCGRTASCLTTYTLSNEGPEIIECAPDRIVECTYEVIAEPENLNVTVSCGLEVIITASDPIYISGDGTCSGAVYEIIYLVTDECGRTANCTQQFTIVNSAPRVYAPEALFISCLDELESLVFNACYYESSCGIPIVSTSVIGPIYNEDQPLCNGSIINYIYSVTDACGRTSTIAGATIFRVDESNLAEEFPDISVDCGAVPDGAEVSLSCGFESLTYSDVSEHLPDGTTEISRTYVATDSCGKAFSHVQYIISDCEENVEGREFCTLDENGWTDPESLASNDNFYGMTLSKEDPLILGTPESEILVENVKVMIMLLAEENKLLSKLIALSLNIRVDSALGKVRLSEICSEQVEKMLAYLGADATINDLLDYANETLAGEREEEVEMVCDFLDAVNGYFKGCNSLGCGEGETGEAGEPNKERRSEFSNNTLGSEILLKAFPNPTSAFINIQLATNVQPGQITIFNAVGQLVFQNENEASSYNLDVRSWRAGIYYIALQEGDALKTEKFVKQD